MANIDAALNNIVRYGTPLQGQIANRMKSSGIIYNFQTYASEAETAVTNSDSTQQKINSVTLNEYQALGELTIGFDPRSDAANSQPALERI